MDILLAPITTHVYLSDLLIPHVLMSDAGDHFHSPVQSAGQTSGHDAGRQRRSLIVRFGYRNFATAPSGDFNVSE